MTSNYFKKNYYFSFKKLYVIPSMKLFHKLICPLQSIIIASNMTHLIFCNNSSVKKSRADDNMEKEMAIVSL